MQRFFAFFRKNIGNYIIPYHVIFSKEPSFNMIKENGSGFFPEPFILFRSAHFYFTIEMRWFAFPLSVLNLIKYMPSAMVVRSRLVILVLTVAF